MRTVNVAELKDKLSAYLGYAKAGETVVVRDRNRPIAKLVPFVAEGATEEELELAARGILKLPEKRMDWEAFDRLPIATLSGAAAETDAMTRALLEERGRGPMSSAFWDSSALIPLIIVEPTSMSARNLAAGNPQAVWWGTKVEIRSAIARQHRAGMIDSGNKTIAIDRLSLLVQMWTEVSPNYELRELASDLLDRYPLRAADSMQLAAALLWCSRKPSGRIFIGADQKLGDAATAAGFTVVRP